MSTLSVPWKRTLLSQRWSGCSRDDLWWTILSLECCSPTYPWWCKECDVNIEAIISASRPTRKASPQATKFFSMFIVSFVFVCLFLIYFKINFSFTPLSVAPVCKASQTLIYGVARTEQVIISCQVESEPITPVKFRWFFNNSLEGFELPSHNFTVELMKTLSSGLVSENGKTLYPTSTLLSRLSSEHILSGVEPNLGGQNKPSVARSNATYSPRNRLGYGTLYCLAENSIGLQRDPCAFSIVEAGKSQNICKS